MAFYFVLHLCNSCLTQYYYRSLIIIINISLSHSKPKRKANAHTKIMLPPTSALLKSPPVATAGSPVFSTPRSSPDDIIANHPQHKCSHNKSVQFGCAQAAEYDIDAPSAKLTPLPPDVAQQRYPLTYSREEHEEEEVAETKENSAVLAEWDSLMDDSDCEDDEEESQMAAAKPKRHHPSIKRRSNSNKKHRKDNRSDRRRSGSFSSHPLNNSRALFDPSLDDDDDHFMDSSITPEKNTNAGVLDTMASLSMASPAPLRNGSAHATHFANTAGSSDDELSPSAAQFQVRTIMFNLY